MPDLQENKKEKKMKQKDSKMKQDKSKEMEEIAVLMHGLRSGIIEQITGWVLDEEEDQE